MLKHAPEADDDTETKTDDALYCAECGQLLTRTGWRFEGEIAPRIFFGLIKTALTQSPAHGQG